MAITYKEYNERIEYLEFGNSCFEVDKMKNRILVKTNKDYLDL